MCCFGKLLALISTNVGKSFLCENCPKRLVSLGVHKIILCENETEAPYGILVSSCTRIIWPSTMVHLSPKRQMSLRGLLAHNKKLALSFTFIAGKIFCSFGRSLLTSLRLANFRQNCIIPIPKERASLKQYEKYIKSIFDFWRFGHFWH